MSLLKDKLNLRPGKTNEPTRFDNSIEESDKLGSYISNAKAFLEKDDLDSAFLYLSKEFHKDTADFYRCARLFEELADKYQEQENYEKALENIEYTISSWTKEAARLESQERNVEICYNNINRLEQKAIEIENKIHNYYKLKRGN